ncbi:MAG: hypothetical protein Q8S55_24565 [Methylococcaceae bacterium]|nr:hypothetical protein [Methylococcaceae bacterium]
MTKFVICFFILLGMSLNSNVLLANPPLPAQYPLNKIKISILHKPAPGIPDGYQITINGIGNSFYSQNNHEKHAFTVPRETLLELVNDFYTIHFFELADTYAVKKQVRLKDNTTVATVVTKLANVSSQKMCIQLRTFKKCVTVVDNQPVEAAQLVKKIEGLFLAKQ